MKNILMFPFPEGMYWEDQGIWSLAVPYGKARDFFYSGHTGFIVFFIQSVEDSRARIVATAILIYVIILLIITRVHYIIDIIGGALFSVFFYQLVQHNIEKCDRVVGYALMSVTGPIIRLYRVLMNNWYILYRYTKY